MSYTPRRFPRFQDAGDLYNLLTGEFHLPKNKVQVGLTDSCLVVNMPEHLIDSDLPRAHAGFAVQYENL